MTAAEQICALRAQTGLTQAAFAVYFGIPKRTIESWEAGKRNPPKYVINLLSESVQWHFPAK